ncbi:MAG: methionine--tRNA ligase [Oligoflexales bacterium]
MTSRRKIVVTAALPYANGDIHLGHMVEHCLVDYWTRFQKMRGHDCAFVCADDTHGTPIMVYAKKLGITPEALIAQTYSRHVEDFKKFEIAHDHYSSTNSAANKELASQIFGEMKKQGYIHEKTIDQLYCEHDKMFLPDRFVKGTCPKCKTPDQYGDACENCSTTYSPMELIQPYCVLCHKTPVKKSSAHLFFGLNQFRDFLKSWVQAHTQKEVANKLAEWLDGELQDWCISRDAPYFGFEIPGYPGKYFYVWLDAPVGYISSTKEWCEKNGKSLNDYWKNPSTEIFHCIGKDIMYFHTLFWPAMLKVSGFNTPNGVWVHGMLTFDGQKLSKSRGTFINAATYLKHLDPTYFRYYLACKLNSDIGDIDFTVDDFVSRVNSDLIGKITNVASRGATMLGKLDGILGDLDEEGKKLVAAARERKKYIEEQYEGRNYAKVVVAIREIADEANRYFDAYEPWKLIKTDEAKTKIVLTTVLNLFRMMAIYLKPILPSYAERVEKLFGEKPFTWASLDEILAKKPLKPYEHLLKRVEKEAMTKIIDESAQANAAAAPAAAPQAAKKTPEIEYADFAKVDLRVGKVVSAEAVPNADKLLQLRVDIGGEVRNIFSGIKSAYKPEQLVGRHVVVVANLKPRKMKFGLSEGMVIAAGDGDEIFLASIDEGAKPGDRIL